MPDPSDFPQCLYVLEDYEIITDVWIILAMVYFILLNSSFAKVVLGHAEHLLYKCKHNYLHKREKQQKKTNSKVPQPHN